MEVSNSTASGHDVALYSAAATIEDGVFLGADGATANDLSGWTSVTPGVINLAAGEKRMATVKVAVPADATASEQYAAVWAETRSDSGEDGVVQVSRVGVRLYVSVGFGAAPASDFTVGSLTPGRSANGDPTVTALVRNTGGRALDVTGTLSMSNGPGGLSAGPFPAELNKTLAAGDAESITITLDERVPTGPWDAVMALKSGSTERSGESTLTFPGVKAVSATRDSSPDWRMLAAVAALVLLLGILAPRYIRSVRHR